MKTLASIGTFGALLLAVLAPAASATITSPAVGSPVSTSGQITIRGSIANTRCAISANGVVQAGLTSVSSSFVTRSCSPVATLTFPAAEVWQIDLVRTWRVNLTLTLTDAITGSCTYLGTITGTWRQDFSAGLVKTITGNSLVLWSGGGLCTTRPIVTGTLTTPSVIAI